MKVLQIIVPLLILICINTHPVFSQNPSAIVEYESTNKGVLIPRMTETQKNNINLPAEGLMIYQTTVPEGFYYFDGIEWKMIGSGSATGDQTLSEVLTEGNDAGAMKITNLMDPMGAQDAATKNYVDFNDDVDDADADSANELNSSLSLNAMTLELTDSGGTLTADLSSLQDGTGTDDQTLSEVLTEDNDAGAMKITNLMDPMGAQDAATKNYVDSNDDVDDADADSTNELNSSLNLNAMTLELTDSGGTLTADLSSLQDGTGTDDQTLSEVLIEDNDAGAMKIVNLADPTSDQDAATKKYVDDNAGGGGGSGDEIKDADDDTKIQVEENADEDRIRFDLGGIEHFVMDGPRLQVKNSGESTFFGDGAGASDNLTSNLNTFIGKDAGFSTSSGTYNTVVGHSALYLNSTGTDNSVFGVFSMFSNSTGGFNSAFGGSALLANTSGSYSSAFGYNALSSNTTSSYNSAFGFNALSSNSTGGSNSSFGSFSLQSNTIGNNNSAFGLNALANNSTASNNTAFGNSSLKLNSTGADNAAFGFESLENNTTGSNNTAVGRMSLDLNTTGSNNTAVGRMSLDLNTTGSNNTTIGFNADVTVADLTNATAIGANASVSQSNSLILGNGADVGIGTSSPDEKLHIVGSIKMVDGNEGAGKLLVSDADGVGSWTTLGMADDQTMSEVLLEGNDAGAMTISNLADPTMAQDAATKNYVDMNDDVDDADADASNELNTSVNLNATTLEITDAGGTLTTDLSSLQDGTGTDDQNISGSGLSGTILTIGIEGGSSEMVDLASLQSPAGSDDQTLSEVLIEGNDAGASQIMNLADPTLAQDAATKNYVDMNDEVDDADADASNELNTSVNLNATTLEITDAGGTLTTDLSSLQDGTGTDDQNISGSGLSGTILTIGIEGGSSEMVDLASLQSPAGSDDQTLSEVLIEGNDAGASQIMNLADPTLAQDAATKNYVDMNDDVDDADADASNELNTSVNLNATTLEITDAGGTLTADLSSLQDGTGTDDQNISGSMLSGTMLTIGIEGGSSEMVDLASLQDGTGTDDQTLTEVLTSGTDAGAMTISNLADPTLAQDAATKNYVDMNDDVDDADADASNELNTSVNLNATTLEITDGGGTLTADLSSLQDGTGTDDQTLTEVLTAGNDAGALKIANLADPTMDQDAATKKYVDDNMGGGGSGDAIQDADSDTKIMVEESADEDKIRFDIGGTEYFVMDTARLEFLNSGSSVFIGEGAGLNDDLSNNKNTFIGFDAGKATTTGQTNVGIGPSALMANTFGSSNVAIGNNALNSNSTGGSNVAIGYESMFSTTTAILNVAVGYQSLNGNTIGEYNVSIGPLSMSDNTSGFSNTAIGAFAMESNEDGLFNTALGTSSDVDDVDFANATAIGFNALVDDSDKVRIGSSSVSSNGGQVAWTAYSDARIKKNIQENIPGLSFIESLRPVSYNFDVDAQNAITGIRDTTNYPSKYDIEDISFSGFIAQEVDAAAQAVGYDFSGVDRSGKLLGLRYSEFVVPYGQSYAGTAGPDRGTRSQIDRSGSVY